MHCFNSTLKHEGFSGLYRGLSTPLLGSTVEASFVFFGYGQMKKLLGVKEGDVMTFSQLLIAGGGAGIAVSFLLTPIELIKCRLQVQSAQTPTVGASASRPAVQYSGPIDCLIKSVRNEGLRVIYKGHSSTMLRETVGSAAWFGTYETFIKVVTPPNTERSQLPATTIISAGGVAGMLYWFVPFPLDTIKSTIQASSATGQPQSPWAVARDIYARGGVRGFYPGLAPTMVRSIPANATLFFVYEKVMNFLREVDPSPPPAPAKEVEPIKVRKTSQEAATVTSNSPSNDHKLIRKLSARGVSMHKE